MEEETGGVSLKDYPELCSASSSQNPMSNRNEVNIQTVIDPNERPVCGEEILNFAKNPVPLDKNHPKGSLSALEAYFKYGDAKAPAPILPGLTADFRPFQSDGVPNVPLIDDAMKRNMEKNMESRRFLRNNLGAKAFVPESAAQKKFHI